VGTNLFLCVLQMNTEHVEGQIYLRDCLSTSSVDLIETIPAVNYKRTPARDIHFPEDAVNKEKILACYQNCLAVLPEQGLYKIDNAVVRDKGLIKVNGELARDNLEGAPESKIREALNDENRAEKTIEEPVLYLTRYGVKNYGHCLTDIIPRILWFHEKLPEIKLALHPEMPDQIYEVLRVAGVMSEAIIKLGDEHTLIKTMYFISLWNEHPLVHTPKAMEYLKLIGQRVLEAKGGAEDTDLYPSKIFVGRKDAATRQIANYDDVSALLCSEGFTEISCGELSFSDQVKYFSAARSVIGIAGASMTNIAFCRPGTPVLALAPHSMPALYFWDIAHHAELEYCVAYFQGIERSAPVNKDEDIFANFTVDLSVLEKYLKGRSDD